MGKVAISEFRAHLFEFLKQVERGESIMLTSHGKNLAMLVPPTEPQKNAREELSELSMTAEIGDVLSPTGVDWKLP